MCQPATRRWAILWDKTPRSTHFCYMSRAFQEISQLVFRLYFMCYHLIVSHLRTFSSLYDALVSQSFIVVLLVPFNVTKNFLNAQLNVLYIN